MKMIESGGVHHIINLNPYKLARIKSSNDLNLISSKADMHIASGAGLNWAAKILRSPLKERIPLLSFIMDIIRIAEIKDYTVFLVGGKPETAEKAFSNIKKSFPKIRIVGRHGGYFTPERERSVIEAIRKSEANVVLIGLGFPKEEKWIYEFKNEFKNTVFISVGGSIDIISGEIKRRPLLHGQGSRVVLPHHHQAVEDRKAPARGNFLHIGGIQTAVLPLDRFAEGAKIFCAFGWFCAITAVSSAPARIYPPSSQAPR
jgi:exopolysaccharide biosynthesis WecB/TagA/CpsF family protein